MSTRAPAALTRAEFARRLGAVLAPDHPERLAVAVSGGADSLALALLAHDWAGRHGAAISAFIVDHGLRRESAREARQVLAWLRAAGIDAAILRWRPPSKPLANRQMAAREARYALLQAACRRAGIGHLLLAHHRDDQAETLLLRALRGSGVDGLAAMAPRRQTATGLVLLRPLLDVSKARLVATLRRRRQAWIEDPSNADPAHTRVRVRRAIDLLARGDGALRQELVAHLAATAANMGRVRAGLEAAAAALVRRCAKLAPGGCLRVDPAPLCAADDEIALRALSRLLCAVGGEALPPRLERLQRLLADLRAGGRSATLHRCVLRPVPREQPLLLAREARHLPPPLPLLPGLHALWDGRLAVDVAPDFRAAPRHFLDVLGPIRPQTQNVMAGLGDMALLPARAVWPVLPAVWTGRAGGRRLVAVPALGWGALPAGLALAWRPLLAGPDDNMP